MSELIYPESFCLTVDGGKVIRINWMRRVGESPYVECGVTSLEDELSSIWMIVVTEEEIKPLFPWPIFTDEERVRVIELIKGMREEVRKE